MHRRRTKRTDLLQVLDLLEIRNNDARVIMLRPERRACHVPADGKFCAESRVVELLRKLSALCGIRIDHQRA